MEFKPEHSDIFILELFKELRVRSVGELTHLNVKASGSIPSCWHATSDLGELSLRSLAGLCMSSFMDCRLVSLMSSRLQYSEC